MIAYLYSLWLALRRRPYRLRDGRCVTVRELTPADRSRLRTFIETLSPAARRRRFHLSFTDLPETLLDHLLRDCGRGRAFVATVPGPDGERIVGEVRFADAEPPYLHAAEFAIAVADDLAGQKLGRVLMRRALRAAAEAGYARICGDVLADNEPMLRLAQSLGFALQHHPDDAHLLRVVRRVPPPQPGAGAHMALTP